VAIGCSLHAHLADLEPVRHGLGGLAPGIGADSARAAGDDGGHGAGGQPGRPLRPARRGRHRFAAGFFLEDPAIAQLGHGLDEARRAGVIAQGAAQLGHRLAERLVGAVGLAPYRLDQMIARCGQARALDQGQQQVEDSRLQVAGADRRAHAAAFDVDRHLSERHARRAFQQFSFSRGFRQDFHAAINSPSVSQRHKETNCAAQLVILAGVGLTLTIFPRASAQEQPSAPVSAPAPAPATPAEYATAIETLAGKLEASYLDPKVGRQYATLLRANAATYAQITDPRALAKRVTDDLRALHPDNHLRVALGGPDGPPGGPGPRRVRIGGPGGAGGPGPAPGPGGLRPQAIEDPKWIAPGVAYIKFNMFDGSAETLATLEAFMKDHLDAKAIIFDARTHRGGGMAEMDVILPYLYAEPTRLVSMDMAQSIVDARGPPRDGPNMRPVQRAQGSLSSRALGDAQRRDPTARTPRFST
jgi:hypothetical protein